MIYPRPDAPCGWPLCRWSMAINDGIVDDPRRTYCPEKLSEREADDCEWMDIMMGPRGRYRMYCCYLEGRR